MIKKISPNPSDMPKRGREKQEREEGREGKK